MQIMRHRLRQQWKYNHAEWSGQIITNSTRTNLWPVFMRLTSYDTCDYWVN